MTLNTRLFSLFLLATSLCVDAQQDPSTLRTGTTLVLVPTLVTTRSGDLVHTLQAGDFRLTDNGLPQTVSVEQVERQPIAMVVLMQTGEGAPAQFANYSRLPTMLDAMMGSSSYKVAVVSFDSRPEDIWDFTPEVAGLRDAFTNPQPGDDGAALLDAVDFGIGLLEKQPEGTRRILLLLSQPYDDGSEAKAERVVRRLGETNTTIYSVTFSPEKKWLKDQFAGKRHAQSPYRLSPDQAPIINTFDLATPLFAAINAMRKDTAAEVATLSGGEHLRFNNRRDLEAKLSVLANHIPNRYTLSFTSTSNQPGFHALSVQLLRQPEGLDVSARASYWAK